MSFIFFLAFIICSDNMFTTQASNALPTSWDLLYRRHIVWTLRWIIIILFYSFFERVALASGLQEQQQQQQQQKVVEERNVWFSLSSLSIHSDMSWWDISLTNYKGTLVRLQVMFVKLAIIIPHYRSRCVCLQSWLVS